MKKIDLDTLEQADRKISTGKMRKALVAVVALLILGGGSYAAYSVIAGEVVASRFTVNRMNCPACVITVKEITGKIPGVVDTDVSLAAQAVSVKFRERQTSPEQILKAITRRGYPAKLDAMFRLNGQGIDDLVVATINGRPVFGKDLKIPRYLDKEGAGDDDAASAFFSLVGKEILLQAADTRTVVVQPYEIEERVEALRKAQGLSQEELASKMRARYGSEEKYHQMIAQRIGIRKLFDEHLLEGIKDPKERERKTLEWVGALFKVADVRILDPKFKEKIHAAAGADDWKRFWPLMISRKTELKNVLMP